MCCFLCVVCVGLLIVSSLVIAVCCVLFVVYVGAIVVGGDVVGVVGCLSCGA